MPVVNDKKELTKVYFWEDVFGEDEKRNQSKLNLPVVIMAGGKGTRLKPLTNVIPKPLIPIGDKTIIEEIMDRFVEVGCDDFYISVNYKAETIKQYFAQLKNDNYKTSYFQEEKPLGTAGSLFLIRDKINTTFFVSNCDIIINEDYSEILKYHRENKNELTIVAALKHYPIPYGTIKTKSKGVLDKLTEKPEITFQINSGMYILEPGLLDEIPENEFFHITHLIENIQKRDGNVGVFPVSEGSWKDIGNLDEYLKQVVI
jgi:NDP-sugar pyrophosphorylase family protein